MKEKDFTNQLLDLIEKNTDLDPRLVFGEMIQLAVLGLYDMAPGYPEAIAIINIATKEGLDHHMAHRGMRMDVDKDKDIVSTKLN